MDQHKNRRLQVESPLTCARRHQEFGLDQAAVADVVLEQGDGFQEIGGLSVEMLRCRRWHRRFGRAEEGVEILKTLACVACVLK